MTTAQQVLEGIGNLKGTLDLNESRGDTSVAMRNASGYFKKLQSDIGSSFDLLHEISAYVDKDASVPEFETREVKKSVNRALEAASKMENSVNGIVKSLRRMSNEI